MIIQITEVPVTMSGKKVEIAVTNILHKEKINNLSAIANPDSLKQFYDMNLIKS
jgi:acetoacetyl-CoA synthetase